MLLAILVVCVMTIYSEHVIEKWIGPKPTSVVMAGSSVAIISVIAAMFALAL